MSLDYFLFQQINNLAGRWVALDWLGIFFASYAQYSVVGLLWIYLFFRKDESEKNKSRLLPGLSLLGALVARFVIATPMHYLFFRPRPFVDHAVNQLINYRAIAASFPSGHAAFFFGLATAYFLSKKIRPEGAPQSGTIRRVSFWLFVAAALISLARVFVGVHYPSDILAGALVGIFSGWLVWRATKKFIKTEQ